MPKEFDDAVRNGGKVVTKSLPNGKYIHLVKYKGKWFQGEVKTKKKGK